ncbi:MAG: sulfatase [Bryobacteraceae bacterium]
MSRRDLLAAAGTWPFLSRNARAASRTNVVFFLTDDHGAWAVGPWGCPEMHTPNLARLAAGGTRFDRAYASTPVCSPSRMTYMTGKLPSAHGVCDALMKQDVQGPQRKRFLDGQLTYTELLAKNGYTVGLSGKWHMGDDEHPHAGFTYWCTIPGGGGTYRDPEFIKNGATVKTKGFKTDLVGDFAIEFLEANKQRPFFLYVPFFAPHTPFDYQPARYRDIYKDCPFSCFPEPPRHPQRRWSFEKYHGNRETKLAYSALVSGMDHNVGRILARLEELGLRENTLVVFSADQGWNAGHHGVWGKGNATIPFNMYEESIRVPLIWNHPGRIRAGQVVSPLVSSYDFFPTILDYLGISAPADRRRVGRSYSAFLRGESPAWRKELFFEYCYVRAIRTENLKYVERADNWPSELFDIEADSSETVNVIGDRAYGKQLAELRGRLRGLFESTGAPPLEHWRSTTRQTILIDSGYYDGWPERRPGQTRRN